MPDSGRRGGLATGHLVIEQWTCDGGGRGRWHGGSRPSRCSSRPPATELAPAAWRSSRLPAQPTHARPWQSSWRGGLRTARWTRDGASRDRAVDCDGGGRARRHGGSRPLAVKLAPACDGARACGMAELTLARVADLRQPGGDGSACPYAGARDGWWRSSRWELAPTLEENHDDG